MNWVGALVLWGGCWLVWLGANRERRLWWLYEIVGAAGLLIGGLIIMAGGA